MTDISPGFLKSYELSPKIPVNCPSSDKFNVVTQVRPNPRCLFRHSARGNQFRPVDLRVGEVLVTRSRCQVREAGKVAWVLIFRRRLSHMTRIHAISANYEDELIPRVVEIGPEGANDVPVSRANCQQCCNAEVTLFPDADWLSFSLFFLSITIIKRHAR